MCDDGGLKPDRTWLLEAARRRRLEHVLNPSFILPWRRPCRVKVLLVTDGVLNFGQGDFGLSTLVGTLLNDRRSYVAFDVTTAHLRSDVTDAEVMAGAPGITQSIKGFAFDEPAHFDPGGFDEVWLFGIETNFHRSSYPNRQASYPPDRLGDAELLALARHMNRGGGLFATGDHGSLGRGLGGSVDRARSMRHWQPFTGSSGQDEVSMTGTRRNDTNDVGHDVGSQFSDQSDDIPQRLTLELHSTRVGLLKEARYPHPVLCSRFGRIEAFPDHPHEGECRTPGDLGLACADGVPEYPAATDGSGQVVPEIIAWGHVPAGNTADIGGTPSKIATQAHRFPLLSAFDGHRADVGRVLCDSTWHHFVNVNLIGILEGGGFDDFGAAGTHASKHNGFLSSAAGQAVLGRIREYFVNVGVWIATPERVACMQSRVWWDIVWNDRVVEAVLSDPSTSVRDISVVDLYHIGVHAQDVLGRAAGPCQSLHWVFPVLDRLWPEIRPWIDPWWPVDDHMPEPPLPWFDPAPLIAVVLGAGIAALHEAYPYPSDKAVADNEAMKVLVEGARLGATRAREQFGSELREVAGLVR